MTNMLERLFPKQFDNIYRGYWLGFWLLAPVLLARLAIGVNSTFNGRTVAASADGIPLDTYGTSAADTVVALFALSGFSFILLSLLGILAMLRYRAMIPLVYLLLLLQQLGNRALILLHPIARSGVATAQLGSAFVLGILALTLIGFFLSLLRRDKRTATTG